MKSLNAKLAVSALSILTILASPAFAQKAHPHSSQQHATNGRGLYDVVPLVDPSGRGIYNMVPAPDNPAATGGGSVGYNQNLQDNKW
jgi:hypothetical protein